MKWISIKDKMPELETDVLLLEEYTFKGKLERRVIVGYLYEYSVRSYAGKQTKSYDWHSSGDYCITEVTHWQPLPDFPTTKTEA